MTQPDWLLANKSRNYPLDVGASGISDNGLLFPEDFIIDLKLQVRSDDNSPIYLSYFATTPERINMTLGQSGKQLAVCSAPAEEVNNSIPSTVKSMDGSNIGKVLFGNFRPGYSYKFSSTEQSRLSPHAVVVYPKEVEQSRFVRDVSVPLSPAEVAILAQGDLEVTSDVTTDDSGKRRKRISIGLRDTGADNLLLEYSGRQNADAESLNCGSPEPISRFGQVQPDCCGRVFIEFRGCVEMVPIADTCGVALKCDVLIDELCPQRSEPVVGELSPDGEIRPDDVGSSEWEELLEQEIIYPDQLSDDCDGPNVDADTTQEDL